jgi:protease secretion system membrane fusion protein
MANEMIVKKTDVAEVVTHDVTPLTVQTDARVYSRMGWLVILFGVCGFLLWAVLAPLDKGVPLQGVVIKEGNRKAVQHQSGGIVDEILVKDGDVVKAGQVLVRLNRVAASSQAETARVQYFTARSIEARAEAERDGLSSIPFPKVLEPYRNDPRLQSSMNAQVQLFLSRRMALQSELGAVDENIAGLKLQMAGLQESRENKKVQLGILKEQLDNMRDLAKDGYVARSRLLDLERTYAQVSGAISEDTGNIGRSQRQVAELSLRRLQRQQEVQKEVRGQLADSQREAEALQTRVGGMDYEVGNTDVKAPVDGTVVALSVFTRGGVIAGGAHMMDIVPLHDGFVVEGQLPVSMIDRVHNGMHVELMFSAFNSNSTPHIPGILTQISADRALDERTGAPYYKVRAAVSPEGVKLIAAKHLDVQPGMPVEVFVKTGERTMMSYLMKPVFDRAKTSMTED